MVTYKKTYVYENTARNLVVSISCYREKFALCDFWRVDYCHKYNGKEYWFTYKADLLNKPNKRQITNYLETL